MNDLIAKLGHKAFHWCMHIAVTLRQRPLSGGKPLVRWISNQQEGGQVCGYGQWQQDDCLRWNC